MQYKSIIHLKSIFVLCIILSSMIAQATETPFKAHPPSYELNLSLNEYSMFNSTVVNGLNQHKGTVEFNLQMTTTEHAVIWKLYMDDPRIIQIIQKWIADESIRLIQSIQDFKQLDQRNQIALNAIKSLSFKLNRSIKNPIWEKVSLSGIVRVDNNDQVFIENSMGKCQITGIHAANIKHLKNKSIVTQGYMKEINKMDVFHFITKKKNLLEVFIMGQCPFGLKTAKALIDSNQKMEPKHRPDLQFYYIFYQNQKGFSSLHGEAEVMENLVQIVIRDTFSDQFFPYLLLRAEHPKENWKTLATKTGLTSEIIQVINNKISTQQKHIIKKEYNYVAGRYQIYDGSPTFVWESERIEDISQIKAFGDMDLSFNETCHAGK